MTRRTYARALALVALVSLGGAGCATRGRVETLEQRVNDLSSRLDAVDRKATDAVSRAEAAERSAAEAASRADEAARKAEAIFKKSVSK